MSSLFVVACAVSAANLFGLGAFKARFHDKQYLRSGAETLLLGLFCAAIAFFVGRAVAHAASGSALLNDARFLAPAPDAVEQYHL